MKLSLKELLSPELEQVLESTNNPLYSLTAEMPYQNSRMDAQIELDLTNMGITALQALYDYIKTYRNSKIKSELLTQFKQECPNFKPNVDAKQFLQHVAYGEQVQAEALLNDNSLAQFLLTARKSFTDYSGRTFKCSAYEYAYWVKDTHMCRMLENHMDDCTKEELLPLVKKIEGLSCSEFEQSSRGLAYIDKHGIAHRSAHFDLTPLIEALKNCIDAYKYNGNLFRSDAEWVAMDATWINVGILQRDIPAHIAQEYCHPQRSFARLSIDHAVLNAKKPENLKRQLKFYNYDTSSYDFWFTPTSYSTESGLGYSFAILRGGWQGSGCAVGQLGGLSGPLHDLSALEAIDKVRTEDIKQSLANLKSSCLQIDSSHG